MSKILVVDDEAVITTQLKEYLTLNKYDVVGTAFSGEEAVDLAFKLKPDLILMDIMMSGNKMDGISAAGKIKSELDIPVIFITAYGGEKIIDKAKEIEPYGFILKPFEENELKAVIEFALIRKDLESRLKESAERFRTVVNTAIEAIITIDIHMKILSWNRAAEIMFQYSSKEAEGKPFTFIIPEIFRKELSVEMDRMVLTEELSPIAKTTESYGLRKDGTEFPLEFSLASWIIHDEISFTIIARDITERKKIEQMKSDFVSLVSHQLKTPVAGIMGCLDNMLLGLAGDITDKQREYLKVMKEISSRNYRIISDLLNASRIERGILSVYLQPVNLIETIDLAVREHRDRLEGKGLTLNYNPDGKEILIKADRDKLVEAFSNVIDNAVKFTSKGSISIDLRSENNDMIIEIADTGKGISRDLFDELFKKKQIFRGSPTIDSGCGLGLYIAMQFMLLQHGDISVTSAVGKGSCFSFKIPMIK